MQNKSSKLEEIYTIIEEIRQIREKRNDDYVPSILVWQIMNEVADLGFLDKFINRLKEQLQSEQEELEKYQMESKIIYLDNYRKENKQ